MKRTGRWLRILLVFISPMVVCSCSTPNYLILTSDRGGSEFQQDFPGRYMLRTSAGDYHFILVEQGVHPPQDQRPDEPLQPAPVAPLRQLVHIHVFWRPIRGAKPDNPSSTNAAIDWYFISNHGLSTQSVVHYQGGGFVTVNASTKSAAVDVRSAALYPAKSSGSLRDPFGTSNVTGSFVALSDPGEVRDLLEEIQKLSR